MKFLMVGIGGGIGAILRYLISAVPLKVSFPVQTFVTNVLGAILIGVVVEMVAGKEISENWNLFLNGFESLIKWRKSQKKLFHNIRASLEFLNSYYMSYSYLTIIQVKINLYNNKSLC